ncbi:MAG: nitroreductase family protein [Clostridiales bacterium]|nr:nitroreductase family protein [Clostridiales bacterium]
MKVKQAIEERRSIRKFSPDPIDRKTLEDILQCALEAPSAKNRQPWRFVVIAGTEKSRMLEAMRTGIEMERKGTGLLPGSLRFLSGAEYTMRIMEQAPVTIFVLNAGSDCLGQQMSAEDQFFEMANLQSIGASIENLLLAAQEKGIGSLWICDIFFAYRELQAFLETNHQLVAAVALGVPRESPRRRPRKALSQVVDWRMGDLL